MWSWLISAVLSPLFGAINDWLKGEQARIDEIKLGQSTQATADANQQTAAANAAAKETADALAASNASLAKSAADPSSVRDPDPDSRD